MNEVSSLMGAENDPETIRSAAKHITDLLKMHLRYETVRDMSCDMNKRKENFHGKIVSETRRNISCETMRRRLELSNTSCLDID